MNNQSPNKEYTYKVIRLLALVIYVVTPILFLAVAYLVNKPPTDLENIDTLLYVLLFLSVFLPTITLAIRRNFVIKTNQEDMTEEKRIPLLFKTFIIIAAMIESIYVFGLVVYFLSGDMQRMLYFYPIGIAWTYIHWPTRDRFEAFVNPIGRP